MRKGKLVYITYLLDSSGVSSSHLRRFVKPWLLLDIGIGNSRCNAQSDPLKFCEPDVDTAVLMSFRVRRYLYVRTRKRKGENSPFLPSPFALLQWTFPIESPIDSQRGALLIRCNVYTRYCLGSRNPAPTASTQAEWRGEVKTHVTLAHIYIVHACTVRPGSIARC